MPNKIMNDLEANELLSFSKRAIDSNSFAKKDADELRVLQYLIFAGMLSYYGDEHLQEILSAFCNNHFCYTNKTISEFLKTQNDFSRQALETADKETTSAFFYQKYYWNDLYGWSNGKIVVSNSKKYAPDILLENVVHEVNHAVNSVNNGVVPYGNMCRTRMGIYIKDHNTGVMSNRIFEESINVLQTAEIMDHILQFVNYDIVDLDIREALDNIKYAAGKKREGFGYTLSVPVIKELYEDNNFNLILKKERMDGQINFIINEFDSKVGNGSFEELSHYFDGIYSTTSYSSNYQEKAKKLIKKYTSC